MKIDTEVAVVGGGAAGLAAARILTTQGFSCVVLEAANRLGGRVHTLRVPDWEIPIELGAEFGPVLRRGALDLRYPATVAGALGSGEHAARELLSTCH